MDLKFTAESTQKLAIARRKMNKVAVVVSRSEMRHFSARSRKSRDCAETYISYVAQGIPLIDLHLAARCRAGTAKEGHF